MTDGGTRGGAIGLVLAGGGARGAYEAGVLSVLLPELERREEFPRVLVGTSIGALNVGVVGGLADRGADAAAAGLLRRWRELRTEDGLVPLYSLGTLRRLVRLAGQPFGLPAPRFLLDLSPYAETIGEVVDFEAVHRNVDGGALSSVAVATTSYATGTCVVFHDSHPSAPAPSYDARRLIDYAPTRLATQHVRASGSIQALARATHVTTPAPFEGWYGDGAARLNTPIKPALRLGADRVVVVGLDPIAPPAQPETGEPDIYSALNQVLDGLLADELAHDIATLASRNAAAASHRAGGDRQVPYAYVVPEHRDVLGEIAQREYREHLSGLDVLRHPDLATLGRLIGAGRSPARGTLYSLLFIHPDFADALIAQGAADAQRWVDEHDDFWQIGPLT